MKLSQEPDVSSGTKVAFADVVKSSEFWTNENNDLIKKKKKSHPRYHSPKGLASVSLQRGLAFHSA